MQPAEIKFVIPHELSSSVLASLSQQQQSTPNPAVAEKMEPLRIFTIRGDHEGISVWSFTKSYLSKHGASGAFDLNSFYFFGNKLNQNLQLDKVSDRPDCYHVDRSKHYLFVGFHSQAIAMWHMDTLQKLFQGDGYPLFTEIHQIAVLGNYCCALTTSQRVPLMIWNISNGRSSKIAMKSWKKQPPKIMLIDERNGVLYAGEHNLTAILL
jgi:hypothetical protein